MSASWQVLTRVAVDVLQHLHEVGLAHEGARLRGAEPGKKNQEQRNRWVSVWLAGRRENRWMLANHSEG